jgi:hypothetical protein
MHGHVKDYPLPPQTGNFVRFDFVGRFNSTFNASVIQKISGFYKVNTGQKGGVRKRKRTLPPKRNQ